MRIQNTVRGTSTAFGLKYRPRKCSFAGLSLFTLFSVIQTLRDGILRVGSSLASKLESEPEVDEWFQCIGESQNAHLLKLYAKVKLDFGFKI
jgi:hypothetical protein